MEGDRAIVNVDFVGEREFSDVLQIPYEISWADLELVLQIQFNCDTFDVKYIDDEGDLVTLSSHEELMEALKVARRNNNTLQLQVFSNTAAHPTAAPGVHSQTENQLSINPITEGEIMTDKEPMGKCDLVMDKVAEDIKVLEVVVPLEKQLPGVVKDVCIKVEDGEETPVDLKEEEREICFSDDNACAKSGRPLRSSQELVKRKKKKLDYYAWLAQDIGRMRNTKSPDVRPKRPYSDSTGDTGETKQSTKQPPSWFIEYMKQFKNDMICDITKEVTRKTTRQILTNLEGAVITSVKESPDGNIVKVPSIAESGNDSQTVYCHSGIVCDHCEQTIVGPRYKCGNCEDYDLCGKCEALDDIHDPSHVFVKIRRPAQGVGRKRDGHLKPLLKKNVYKEQRTPLRLVGDDNLKRVMRLEKKLSKTQQKLHKLLPDPQKVLSKEKLLDLPQFRKPLHKLDAQFVHDVTFPDGSHVYVGQTFTKCWTVKNTGQVSWPEKSKLKMMWGNLMTEQTEVPVAAVDPAKDGTLSVELTAPPKPGVYQSHWRLHTGKGEAYGHRLWCHVVVDSLPPDIDSYPQPDEVNIIEDELTEKDITTEELPDTEVEQHEIIPPLIDITNAEDSHQTANESDAPESITDVSTVSVGSSVASSNVEADLLSAKDILSCQNLDVDVRLVPKVSQTSTPNNTPLGVTPPNELEIGSGTSSRQLSCASSVEIVQEDEIEESREMTELVRQKIASFGIAPDVDIESLSSCDSEDSSTTESDFFIVPLPDCFNLDKPITRSMMAREEAASVRSVDGMLSSPDSVNAEALTSDVPIVVPDSTCMLSPPEMPKETGVNTEAQPVDPQADNDAMHLIPQQEPDDGEDDEDEDDDNDDVGNEDGVQTDVCDDGETEVKVNLSATTQTSPARTPQSPTEIASNLASAAVDVATNVATKAYSTAKDIFHHLQAQEQYQPKQSNWTPPEQEWTPPKNTWMHGYMDKLDKKNNPNECVWSESQGMWLMTEDQPAQKELSPMQKLVDMGFANRAENTRLLQKYDNDVEKVVQELLENNEGNDWHQSRH